jgi:hypothetical protein
MAAEIREKNLRIAFFNSTPQVRGACEAESAVMISLDDTLWAD